MSFILDALKKSDQERRRQQAPSVTDLTYGQRTRSKPLWIWLVIGLALLNFVLLMLLWVGNNTPSTLTVRNEGSSSTSTMSQVMTPAVSSLNREVRVLEEEASNPTDSEDTTSILLNNASSSESAPLVQAASASTNQNGITTYTQSNHSGQMPTFASLGGAAALNLADLRLDLHVYSDAKMQRFAFINSKKYLEGQALIEGPLLEQITTEGVILSYRGQRFLLPRQ